MAGKQKVPRVAGVSGVEAVEGGGKSVGILVIWARGQLSQGFSVTSLGNCSVSGILESRG